MRGRAACSRRKPYFGTVDPLVGGRITGVVAPLFWGGLTVMPGSTLGGAIVPFCRDNRSLRFPPDGAIFSGGGDAAFGGATVTLGSAGEAGCGFCASAGVAARINPATESVRSMEQCPFRHGSSLATGHPSSQGATA
jgi:hypothetical protein